MKKLLFGALAAGVFMLGRADAPVKVKVCHMPNPNGVVMEVPTHAVPGHLSHGDFTNPLEPAGWACGGSQQPT